MSAFGQKRTLGLRYFLGKLIFECEDW